MPIVDEDAESEEAAEEASEDGDSERREGDDPEDNIRYNERAPLLSFAQTDMAFYDDKMVAMISPQLEKVILQSLALQDQLREQFTRAFTLPYGTPEQAFQQMAEQYQAFTESFKAAAPVGSMSEENASVLPSPIFIDMYLI